MGIKVDDYGTLHAIAQCDVCDWEDAIKIDEPNCMGKLRYRIRKHVKNNHPTVKPIALLEYLVKLTSMPNPKQRYLDPFMGSGTTGMACNRLGKSFIGIERNKEYFEIAKKRIQNIIYKKGGIVK